MHVLDALHQINAGTFPVQPLESLGCPDPIAKRCKDQGMIGEYMEKGESIFGDDLINWGKRVIDSFLNT